MRPPVPAHLIYPHAIFRKGAERKHLCLTFDDGPDPGSTPKILKILSAHSVHGIFFCSGNAAEKHKNLINRIISEGHLVGNHSYTHKDGWMTSSAAYLEDVRRADRFTSSVLFRPPYGRMRISQYRELRQRYMIVLWDVMPYDYDTAFGAERSLEVLRTRIRPGSVIALHDKPGSCSLSILNDFILYAKSKGYLFSVDGFC